MEKFGINRDSSIDYDVVKNEKIKYNFGFDMISSVDIGSEGEKVIGNIESKRGRHGRYFFKRMDEVTAFRQLEKYRHLKKHGAPVPPIFKPVNFENGDSFVLISDLTENDKYLVVSPNNPEVKQAEFQKITETISDKTTHKLTEQLISACEAAVQPRKLKDGKVVVYDFQMNAFMLAVNPINPEDAKIYVADIGADMTPSSLSADRVLGKNIKTAAAFYAYMVGRPIDLPEKYIQMKDDVDVVSASFLERRKQIKAQ